MRLLNCHLSIHGFSSDTTLSLSHKKACFCVFVMLNITQVSHICAPTFLFSFTSTLALHIVIVHFVHHLEDIYSSTCFKIFKPHRLVPPNISSSFSSHRHRPSHISSLTLLYIPSPFFFSFNISKTPINLSLPKSSLLLSERFNYAHDRSGKPFATDSYSVGFKKIPSFIYTPCSSLKLWTPSVWLFI